MADTHSKKKRNRLKRLVSSTIARALSPAFALAMHVGPFRRLVINSEDPKKNLWTRAVYRLYWDWWRHRKYDESRWEQFQKEYWETIGVQRWRNQVDVDPVYFEAVSALVDDNSRAILELGCGHGQVLQALAERHPQISLTGIDASSVMCESARRRCPRALVICDFYGPHHGTKTNYDLVIARSTLTYVDETAVDDVLRWIFTIATRAVVIVDPSGVLDNIEGLDHEILANGVVKRLHDHTHVRDYASYVQRLSLPFALLQESVSRDCRGRTWIFVRQH